MHKSPIPIAVIFLFLILIACTCQANQNNPSGEDLVESAVPSPVIPPDQMLIWETWESSSHEDTYDLEKGPNTYCAKCHSPANWDYSATIDPPPNCVSCKFSSEPEPRIAESNPMVPEDEWASIGCNICHRMEAGKADPEFVWYDNASEYYETLATTTELCEKCHLDTNKYLHHQRDLGQDAHVGFTCTDCHDPHDQFARCSDKGCHSDVTAQRKRVLDQHVSISEKETCLVCHTAGMDMHTMEIQRSGEDDCFICHDYLANISPDDAAPIQHSNVHGLVDCVACHDAAGLAVGPIEAEDVWTTFRSVELPMGLVSEPYQSHNLQRSVECGRCHYSDNPWELSDSVESYR